MQDNASGPIKKVGTTAAQTSDDIAKSMDKAGGAYEKFNEKSKRVSNDFRNQQKKLQLLKDKYVELYSTMGSGAAETQKVGAEIEELSGKVAKNRKALEEAEAAADSFDKSIEQVPNSMDKAGKSADGFGSSLEGLIPKLTKAMLIKKSVEAVADFAVQTVEQASAAETSFAKVSTLLSGTDNSAYFESIKKGSQETGVAISDFSDAVYNALSASVDQANAVQFTTSAIKLAKGGFTDAATSVDVLTTAINAYGLEASDATRISDKLITTQNLGKTTVGELAQNLGRSIPTARAYNVSIDELLASYAVMTKNGNQAAESTTLINAMLNEVGKSGTTTAKIIKEKTGHSFSELMASGTSLTDVLKILADSASASGLTINDLFGSAEAGKGANILLNNVQDVNAAVAAMGDSAGATESAYSKVMDTLSEKMAKLKNNWELVKESLGTVVLPAVSGVVDWLNSGFDKIFGKNEFKGQASNLEEATQKAKEYGDQIDAIYAKYEAGEEITSGDMYRINQLTGAMNDYLAQAEAFKNGTAEIADAAADPAQKFEDATNQYISSAEALMAEYQATYENTLANVEKWFGPFDEASTNVKTSLADITAGLQSQIDYNTKYSENLQYLADSGLGSMSDALQAYGKDGAAYAAALVESLESVGGASTAEGQAIVENLLALSSGVEESQSKLATSMTDMNGEFASKAEEIAADYAEMIEGLNKADEAASAAKSTMDSFVQGLEGGKGSAAAVMAGLADTMMSALQGNLGTVSIGVQLVGGRGITANGMVSFSSKAIGADYIPYNGYLAELHRGEAILTSYEADQWRRGRSGGNGQGITIVQNISATPQTPAQFAATTEAYFQRARWAF